jgi:hypothetical protein
MIKRRLHIFLFVTFGAGSALAQQDAHFSHYMFNQSLYNPAWLTQEQNGYISALHRTQWAGYNTSFDGSGGRPTLVLQTIDFNEYRFVNPDDPLNKGGQESQFRPDVGVGAMYSNASLYFGLALNHIISPSFDFGVDNIQNRLSRSVNLMGGYSFRPSYSLEISPTLLVRSTFRTITFDVSAIATYQNKLWGGLSFRESEAMILLLGYNFLKDGILKLGYSFDYVVENQQAKQPTSHEVFMRYRLGGLTGGSGKKIIRTPRYRF